MVHNSLSKRSSLSKVVLLIADPGHLRDWVPTIVKGGRYPKVEGKIKKTGIYLVKLEQHSAVLRVFISNYILLIIFSQCESHL